MEMPKTAEELSAIVKAAEVKARAEGVTEGDTQGRKTEKTRMAAILGLDEAKGRGAMAQTIALETGLSAEEAKKLLASTPAQAAPADKTNPLADAMKSVPNPKVGPGGGGPADEEAEAQALVEGIKAFVPKRGVR